MSRNVSCSLPYKVIYYDLNDNNCKWNRVFRFIPCMPDSCKQFLFLCLYFVSILFRLVFIFYYSIYFDSTLHFERHLPFSWQLNHLQDLCMYFTIFAQSVGNLKKCSNKLKTGYFIPFYFSEIIMLRTFGPKMKRAVSRIHRQRSLKELEKNRSKKLPFERTIPVEPISHFHII